MTLEITPLKPTIGARISGVDLSKPLDADTRRAIEEAWLEHIVLVFQGQDLEEDQQTDFAAHFGTVGERSRPPERRPEGADYNPAIMLVSNIREDGKPIGSLPDGEMWFHHDMCYVAAPFRGTFLYGIEIPATGGNTRFADMYGAYDILPQEVKKAVAGKKALQVYDYNVTGTPNPENDFSDVHNYAQDVVITHPLSGRKALYVNPLMTVRIEGLPQDESDALLKELFAFTDHEELIYEHAWTPGDLLMWDNWCSCHARTDFPETERRLLRRCTILGQPLSEELAA